MTPAEARIRLRLTEHQHSRLQQHLFPGDGCESVALLLCGRGGLPQDELWTVHEVMPIADDMCVERTPMRVQWRTDLMPVLLDRARRDGFAVLKIHSHPSGPAEFSSWDDAADRALFPGVYCWTATERPHGSAIMRSDGVIAARTVRDDGTFLPVDHVVVIGSQIRIWPAHQADAEDANPPLSEVHQRTAQAFGRGTTELLSHLSIGIVGCSGTGSWVVEMLARLGVGELVLIDPDVVEPLNLNRIVHATAADAAARTHKVKVLARAVSAMGTGTYVEAHPCDVIDPAMVRRLTRCDAIMGCVDAIDARDLLNRMATYYTLPYVDVGVRLVADGHGNIDHIAGTAHYVHPESPSLMDRGMYTPKQLADAGLRRVDPNAYQQQVHANYIRGAVEARPAVASINAFYASLAVNELLARLHVYRDAPQHTGVTISLSQLRVVLPPEGPPSPGLSRRIGRGDTKPLLGLPVLSE